MQAPADANLAPPGYYMLFIVNSAGVPSIAPSYGCQPPTRIPSPRPLPRASRRPAPVATVSLTWGPATDNQGVTLYNVYRSPVSGFTPSLANRIGQTASTSYSDSGLAAGTYYYLVTAQDAAGNIGPASNEAAGTATADVTPPTVSLTSPANGATVTGSITVSANASDDVGVAGVQFFLNGTALGAEDTSGPYSITWNTTTVSNGSYTLTAIARDASGNRTTSAGIGVTVSNTAPTGLVAAYSFDEGVGTTLTDSSGYSNNGTITNATWSTAGHSNQALVFNGSSSRVTVADSTSLHLTTGMTLEAWLYPTAAATDWTAAVLKERSGGLAYALYATDGAAKPPAGYIDKGGTDYNAAGTSVLSLNTWTHLATTYDGAALKLYVNGAMVKSRALTGTIIASTGPLDIGSDAVWGEYFAGLIDDVRVYNRALSQAEIQTDMNTPVGGTPSAARGCCIGVDPEIRDRVLQPTRCRSAWGGRQL